ncbi:MAG: sporulation protein [Saprospiraceae bacterium]|nr:sporulation protein [Saprospiraceae bacterium]
MFGEIKKMLGIEDIRINIEIPEKVKASSGIINGKVIVTSLRDSSLDHIEVKLIEKYSRGRKENKLVDEYTCGTIVLDTTLDVKKQDVIEIPFELPFTIFQSEMDKVEAGNFLAGGFIKLAKKIKGVSSSFRVEATAHVHGTKLSPFVKKDITIL